ncbi:MAG: hypothetical protein KGY76_07145 [Candidatus Thermoplasmatota archaeon]|nr:hypothetical protein [Candidatus Thermoplasmatota archaeon]
MKAARSLSLVIVGLMLLSSLALMNTADAGIEEEGWSVTIEKGTTDEFGGGNYTDFIFQNEEGKEDARFGLIWGTEENPNSIVMVTNQTRYLGRVSVEAEGRNGEQEREIEGERFIKVGSMFGAKITKIFEYEDTQEDGIAPYISNDGAAENSSLYKYVDLEKAAWEASEIEEKESEGSNTTWEISLTAEDLEYESIVGEQLDQDEVLDRVEFTFHLKASIEEVEGVEMPQYRLRVEKRSQIGEDQFGMKDRHRVREMERKGDKNCTGVVGSYEMKWDKEIEGWDFNSTNEDPNLVVLFRNFFGNRVQDMGNWQRQFMHRSREHVRMRTEGFETNFSVDHKFKERRLMQNRIEYGGDWSRVGMFRWVSNVTVDGEEKNATAQIFGGMPWVHPLGFELPEYVGFMTWGGLNYPGGQDIFHDPAVSGDAYLSLEAESEDDSSGLFGNLMDTFGPVGSTILLGSAIVIILVALFYRRSGGKPGKENKYDKEEESEKEDWSEYYDRDR